MIFILTDIKFNSFQRKSIKTLKDAPVAVNLCLSCIGIHYEITVSIMTIKTTKKKQEKTKKSVEKCKKNVSKPFKP